MKQWECKNSYNLVERSQTIQLKEEKDLNRHFTKDLQTVISLEKDAHKSSYSCTLKPQWGGFPGGSDGKESACNVGDPGLIQVWSLGWEDNLEKEMATHSSILAWRIPMDRGAWWPRVCGVTAGSQHGESHSWTQLSD